MNSSKNIIFHSNILSQNDVPFINVIYENLKNQGVNLILTGWNGVPKNWRLKPKYLKTPAYLDYFNVKFDLELIIKEFEDLDLSVEFLLERFTWWFEFSDSNYGRRLSLLHFYLHHYSKLIKQYKPIFCLIWNGNDPRHIILKTLCDKYNVEQIYLERGPLPSVMFYDSKGVLSSSSLFELNNIQNLIVGESESYKNYINWYSTSSETLWAQPKNNDLHDIRQEFNIPKSSKITLFVGQIDNDVQTKKYSPYFTSNLKAFEWFVNNLRHEEYFVIGKHHPKSDISVDEYRVICKDKRNIIWTDELDLNQCLKIVDNVVAVNSSVIFDALLHKKPVMTLGTTMLDNKDILYEYVPDSNSVVSNFYNKIELENKVENFDKVLKLMFNDNLLFVKRELDAKKFTDKLKRDKPNRLPSLDTIAHEQVIYNYLSSVNIRYNKKELTFKEKLKSDINWYLNKILKKIKR